MTNSTPEYEYKKNLKKAFIDKVSRILTEKGLSIPAFVDACNQNDQGLRFIESTVRGWLREDDKRLTFPAPHYISVIAQKLGTDINFLLNFEKPHVAPDMFYQVLRKPEDEMENSLVAMLARIGNHFKTNNGSYHQADLESIFEYHQTAGCLSERQKLDRFAFHQILFTHLVKFDIGLLLSERCRNLELEQQLHEKLWSPHSQTTTAEVRVFKLPNFFIDDQQKIVVCNGIGQAVFFRCVASYFERTVKPGDSIGLAGGKSIASMMQMVERTSRVEHCRFFPLLRIGGGFAAAPITSTSIVSQLLFRMEDLDVKLPPGRIDEKPYSELVSNCKIICTSLGNNRYSTLLTLLRRFHFGTDIDLKQLAGDILFNLVDKNGRTLDEIAEDRHYESDSIRSFAQILKESSDYRDIITKSQFPLTEILH